MTDSIQRRAEQELRNMRNLDRINARAHAEHVRRFNSAQDLLGTLFRDEHTIPIQVIQRAFREHREAMPWATKVRQQAGSEKIALHGIVTDARHALDIDSYAIGRRLLPMRWKEYSPQPGSGTLWTKLSSEDLLRWLREEREKDQEQQAMT